MTIQWAIMHRSNSAIIATGRLLLEPDPVKCEEEGERDYHRLVARIEAVREVDPDIARSLEVRRLR